MKGDFSRFSFDKKNRYSRVLMQQGRVQLDADWNEQLDISAYRAEAEMSDFIGKSGAPVNPIDTSAKEAFGGDANAQSTSFRITTSDGSVSIGEGRYYIEGMLFENLGSLLFTQQPDYPDNKLPTDDGLYLAYLDAWQHHVTALEAEGIRETALGGADTTTRLKNVWQVKLHPLGTDLDLHQLHTTFRNPDWKPDWAGAISTGTLKARVQEGASAIVENQLYRVEIHDITAEAVRFKWSRDNGAIAASIAQPTGNKITLQSTGRDPQFDFAIGQLVEISDQSLELNGESGLLATIEAIQEQTLTVKWQLLTGQEPPTALSAFPTVRRWDCQEATAIQQGDWLQLEQGIEIQFDTTKTYKPGDYWLIPARALKGNIEWPKDSPGEPPHGVQHHYVTLALLECSDSGFNVLADYRQIFKPITLGFLSKAGDTMRGDLTIDTNLYIIGKAAIGYNDINQTAALAVRNNVGIGEIDPKQNFVITNGKAAIGYNDINQTAALAVRNNVGIGEIDPKQKLVVTSGKVAIGYNDANQTAALAVSGNVGIGTITPQARLEIGGSLQATANNQTLTALHIKSTFEANNKTSIKQNGFIVENGTVGIGTVTPEAYTTARLVVKSATGNGGNAQSDPESVLSLTRDGAASKAWPNIVDLRIGRYDDGQVGLDNQLGNLAERSRTQLDIVLAHGNWDRSGQKYNNVMTLQSNGNVNINGVEASLAIAGRFGNWKIKGEPTGGIFIEIERTSYNNIIPIHSESIIKYITISLKKLNVNEKPSMNDWIAVCQAMNDSTGGFVLINLDRVTGGDNTISFSVNRELGTRARYVLLTVCLASKV
jgi:hypothetical protein